MENISIQETYFPKINRNEHAFETLSKDVEQIFLKKDPTSKVFKKIYIFEDNRVGIIFQRIWVGRSALDGIDLKGIAEVMMQKRDSILEKRICEIIQKPLHELYWEINSVPIVSRVSFK